MGVLKYVADMYVLTCSFLSQRPQIPVLCHFCHTHNQTLSIYFMLSKQLVTLSFSGGGHQIFSKLLSYFASVVNSELNNIVINFLHAQFYLTGLWAQSGFRTVLKTLSAE